jgi:hypothetical protein
VRAFLLYTDRIMGGNGSDFLGSCPKPHSRCLFSTVPVTSYSRRHWTSKQAMRASSGSRRLMTRSKRSKESLGFAVREGKCASASCSRMSINAHLPLVNLVDIHSPQRGVAATRVPKKCRICRQCARHPPRTYAIEWLGIQCPVVCA